jgi:hypothetical protein
MGSLSVEGLWPEATVTWTTKERLGGELQLGEHLAGFASMGMWRWCWGERVIRGGEGAQEPFETELGWEGVVCVAATEEALAWFFGHHSGSLLKPWE